MVSRGATQEKDPKAKAKEHVKQTWAANLTSPAVAPGNKKLTGEFSSAPPLNFGGLLGFLSRASLREFGQVQALV